MRLTNRPMSRVSVVNFVFSKHRIVLTESLRTNLITQYGHMNSRPADIHLVAGAAPLKHILCITKILHYIYITLHIEK